VHVDLNPATLKSLNDPDSVGFTTALVTSFASLALATRVVWPATASSFQQGYPNRRRPSNPQFISFVVTRFRGDSCSLGWLDSTFRRADPI